MKVMRTNGFTIVELLVVIGVIGILTTIGVVAYNSYRDRANDTAVQSDLDQLAGILESFRQTPANSDYYPQTKAMLDPLGIKATKNSYKTSNGYNYVYCINNSADLTVKYKTYTLAAESQSGNLFMLTETGLKTPTFTHANLVSGSLCSTLGMGLVSSGMYNPNTWQTWVGST